MADDSSNGSHSTPRKIAGRSLPAAYTCDADDWRTCALG